MPLNPTEYLFTRVKNQFQVNINFNRRQISNTVVYGETEEYYP